jgi:hypothetical protein
MTNSDNQVEGKENDIISLSCSKIHSLNYIGNITYICKSDGNFHVLNTNCRNSKTSLLQQLTFEVRL